MSHLDVHKRRTSLQIFHCTCRGLAIDYFLSKIDAVFNSFVFSFKSITCTELSFRPTAAVVLGDREFHIPLARISVGALSYHFASVCIIVMHMSATA
jgi:hypothetical protein